jgi:hypothetical protein
MLNKHEVIEMINFYREEQLNLPLEAQTQINAIFAALTHTVKVTGKQGEIAAGIFVFEKLLELINVNETQTQSSDAQCVTTGQDNDGTSGEGDSGTGLAPGSDAYH